MLELKETTQFHKDIKRMKKRGKLFQRYKETIYRLVSGQPLPYSFRAHKLAGEWADFWEGHLEPDWLLIYKKTKEAIILTRTGTHADLFE